jgi:hypothetical protein
MATSARLLLVLAAAAASLHAAAARHRSLGVRAGAGRAGGDAAVDLNDTNFDAFLKASPESFAVVEFFAHWSASRLRLLRSFFFWVPSIRLALFRLRRCVSHRVAELAETGLF